MQRLLTCWARGRAPASRALTQSRCLSSSELEGAPAGKTETVARHRPVMNLYEQRPKVGYAATFVAPNATVVGDVELVDKTSTVWYGAVLRGDKNSIKVGGHSSIGDNTSITTVSRLQNGFPARCTIGNWTIVEPGCSLTSCAIGNSCKVGSEATCQPVVLAPPFSLTPSILFPKCRWALGARFQRAQSWKIIAPFFRDPS
jgi:NDP-sugar pyrophosphorylase family protein